MTRLPLTGVRVLALEQAVAAPLCTRHLADLGADVVKVERPGEGDFARGYDSLLGGLASWLVWLNGGKRSIAVDLKHEAGRQIIHRLADRADIVVQNFLPGTMEKLGLGVDQLRAGRPRLIAVAISGFGETGSYASRKAYDALVQGEVGLIAITGTPDQPAKVGISAVDIATGVYSLSSILAALYQRTATGEGATIRTTLFDSMGEWVNPAILQARAGRPPKRAADRHAAIVPYGPYRCGGGRRVSFAVQNEREWRQLCAAVLLRPELATDPRFDRNELRVINRDDLEPEIERLLADVSLDEAERRLEAAGIAYARTNEPGDVLDHPAAVERDRLRVVHTSAGDFPMLRPPFNVDGWPTPDVRVPDLGEHTDAVLAELGYDAKAIADLRAAGAVA
ncbi:MAG: CaiB/BaiF CoA-transferase family protein [Dehalococcoidia bacterium]